VLSAIGLLAGLTLLIYLTIRGMNLLLAAPLCALLVALSAGLGVFPQEVNLEQVNFLRTYMDGFTGFIWAPRPTLRGKSVPLLPWPWRSPGTGG
jgi:H+/gluconate symporter-like permease